MLRSLHYSCAAALALLLSSCGPSYFLAIQPTLPNGPRVDGRPTTLSQHPDDSVQVRTSFVRYEENELVFDEAVSNESRRPVLVDPATFFYMAGDSAAPKPAAAPSRVAAIDPELRLKQLAAHLNEEPAKAEKVSWLELLTSASHIAEDISSIKKKETPQQIAEREQRQRSESAVYDDERQEHAQQADRLYDQHRTLATAGLRKTSIAPGEVVVGQVHFPRTDQAKQIRMVVFFNERPVPFDFVQKQETYREVYAQTATAQ